MLPSFYDAFFMPALTTENVMDCGKKQEQSNAASDVNKLLTQHDSQKVALKRPFSKAWEKVKVVEIPKLQHTSFRFTAAAVEQSENYNSGSELDMIQIKRPRQIQNDDVNDEGFLNLTNSSVLSSLPPIRSNLFCSGNIIYIREKQSFIVKDKEMRAFFRLVNDELIRDFLEMDSCMRISDQYLIAMVFAYFKRAHHKIREYTRMNFFLALYLANDMEEDEEEAKYEIFPWALGHKWKDRFPRFLRRKDLFWSRIGYRAVVSRRCCEEIMAIEPGNNIWARSRPIHHSGALRSYLKDPDDDGYPRGPNASPRHCVDCDNDSQYNSASPDSSTSCYLSSDDSSPIQHSENVTSFDMKRLKKTLPANDDAWPNFEE